MFTFACVYNNMEIPRLGKKVNQDIVDASVQLSFQRLGYEKPTEEQRQAIREFVIGQDVVVILPTGSGKSLCFVALPLVFDCLRHTADSSIALTVMDSSIHCSIVVVMSPLTALMKNQVTKYGRSYAFIGGETDESCSLALFRGDYQLVYVNPEAIIAVPRWREMLRSPVYEENIVALVVDEAHCMVKL